MILLPRAPHLFWQVYAYVSCFSKIQIGFTFLVAADPGSPGQGAVKRVCVCVCARVLFDKIASVCFIWKKYIYILAL